jgi:hypothetical protein
MIYMSPRIVARFDRFSIGLGDLVFVSSDLAAFLISPVR